MSLKNISNDVARLMAENLSASHGLECFDFPGEFQEENDVEKQAPVTCTLWNDLPVAAEIELGQGNGWQIIYPEVRTKLAMGSMDVHPQLSVRLRDDPNVWGMCTAVQGSTLQLSNSFGDFGDWAAEHVQKEAREAKEARRLRKRRQKEIDKKLGSEVTQAVLRKQKWVMISNFFCMLIVLTAMIYCAVASRLKLQGVGFAVGLLGLWACSGWGIVGLCAASGGSVFGKEPRGSVQAVRPELQRYQDQGIEAGDDWKELMFGSCACCAPLVFLSCLVAMTDMTVAFDLKGDVHLSAALWGPLTLAICCGGVHGWRYYEDQRCTERVGWALLCALAFPFAWPFFILKNKCLAEVILKPPKKSLDAAVHSTHKHTIVFEGNVLAKRETVCSWPGKYATAWDTLVDGSRQDDISAAVVFLPEGSKHYGFHDPIPAKQDLHDLHGECWCTPLYGKRKPWGCRWWSKWIANIEQAVSQECTLVVYYFNGMRGQGKVKDFTAAGEEHMRREAILRRKDAFLESDSFQNTLESGLKHLSKEQGPDSSSPYSREVHRLFLASLSVEDFHFLEESEGLGNSQKAEVAWLERNGYPYIEKEVRELESSSPKVIGRAINE